MVLPSFGSVALGFQKFPTEQEVLLGKVLSLAPALLVCGCLQEPECERRRGGMHPERAER